MRKSPKQAALYLRAMKQRVLFETAGAEAKTGIEGVRIAHKWSSGGAGAALLRKLGSPYGLGVRAVSAVNPALINKQSGLFLNSWKWKTIRKQNSLVLQVLNNAPYAHFLDAGTNRMIRRPIREAILKELQPIRRRNLQIALRRARGR
jgi:hypothetical protein